MTTINRTKDRQCNDHHCIVCPSSFSLWSLHFLSFVLFIVVIVLSVLFPFYRGHCIVCPSSYLLWSLHCLFFVLFIVVIALSVLKRTKDRQCNDHNKKDEGQTIPWPQLKGQRTDNTMTTINRTKDNLFIVVIVLSVLRPFHCGHCIVCPSSFLLWSLYFLSFVLFIVVIALSVLRNFIVQWPQWKGRRRDNTMTTIKRTKDRQYNDDNNKDEGQTIQWPQ
jgi:ABC-type multidrug transport system fused ATPase/permease subunit